MAEIIVGYGALQRRLAAISGPALGKQVMSMLGMATVREAKLLVHRKTGNLGRSIHMASATETSATIIASANYAAYVELGTKPHEITPNARKALRWAAGPSGGAFRRLTGSPRMGAPAGAFTFATHVNHPGTRPYPFMVPGAEKAIAKAGLADKVVAAWNGAA